MDEARLSVNDLQVLMVCIMYHYDARIVEGYVLYDRFAAKPKPVRLKVRKDF